MLNYAKGKELGRDKVQPAYPLEHAVQGYALHGHVNLHTWHAHMGSTGTSSQYILPVPWSRDNHLLGTMSLGQPNGKTLQMVSGVSWNNIYILVIHRFLTLRSIFLYCSEPLYPLLAT